MELSVTQCGKTKFGSETFHFKPFTLSPWIKGQV